METLVKVAAGTVAFVPLGALIMILMKGKYQAAKSMGASFALALCVEILQLVLKTGVFDLGNLLFHTIGAGIGIVFVIVFQEKCVLLCHASDAEYSDRVDASGNGGVRSLSCTAYDRTGTYG